MTDEEGVVRRYRLDVAYDGSGFAGFARQPGQRTVQGELERALGTLLGHEVTVAGAGRTDAGVHALGQVTAFATAAQLRLDGLARSVEGIVGPDIAVRGILSVPPRFDPRRDAVGREYVYLVGERQAPLVRSVSWQHGRPLEAGAMGEAAAMLTGRNDFSSFALSDAPEPRVRDLTCLDVGRLTVAGCALVGIRALADGFVRGMVRALAGTLVEVGRGRRPSSWAREVLDARDRAAAGPSAPAHGLVLTAVHYEPRSFAAARDGDPFAQLTGPATSLDSG